MESIIRVKAPIYEGLHGILLFLFRSNSGLALNTAGIELIELPAVIMLRGRKMKEEPRINTLHTASRPQIPLPLPSTRWHIWGV